jgi:hypothetical protein
MTDVQTDFRTLFPYRLGKKVWVNDPRSLKLEAYLQTLPPAPPSFDGTQGIPVWGMMANDHVGDCTCAAAGHMEMAWSKLAGTPASFTDQDILDLYGRVNGGHDDGAVELFVLKEWRNKGLAGKKIHAYAMVRVADTTLVRQAIALFTGLYIGISLPRTAQGQAVWDDTGQNGPDAQPGSWGGHAVSICAYDEAGLTCVTWGALKKMTWNYWRRYVEEAWAVIPENFDGSQVDFRKLDADLEKVSSVNP